MATALFGLGLGVALALLFSIHRKLDRIPARLWAIAREERERDDTRALDTLQEATAAKVGKIVTALRGYEEQLAANFRAQVAEAQDGARIAKRDAAATREALAAATELVRALRATLEGQRAQGASRAAETQAPDQRQTTPMPEPPASCERPAAEDGDGDGPEEQTKVFGATAASPPTRVPVGEAPPSRGGLQ